MRFFFLPPLPTSSQAALLLSSLLLLLSCHQAISSRDPSAKTVINADDPAISWTGRTYAPGDGPIYLDWPGVLATFRVSGGTYIKMTVVDTTVTGTRFAIYVSGAKNTYKDTRIQTLQTMQGVNTYLVAAGLNMDLLTDFTYKIQHIEEPASVGASETEQIAILSFETDGVFVPPPAPPKRRLEIIGDSITAGYGTNALEPCFNSIWSDDYSLTYAHHLCTNFSAACMVEAWSGMGMRCNYGDPCQDASMPDRWSDSLGGSNGLYPWDFEKFVPDAVVINLGTNDFCCGRDQNRTVVQGYEEAYFHFVRDQILVRYKKPHLPVFLGVGPMTQVYAGPVKRVLRRLEAANVNAHYLNLDVDNARPTGCNGHPSAETHIKVAEQARQQIAEVLHWDL